MALSPTNEYVKFVRGTTSAFKALTNKANDTLYFIYDADDTSSGSLYLGSRLIGGTGSAASSSLGDLKDVLLTELGDKELIVYDEASKSWKNITIDEILPVDNVSIAKTEIGSLELKGFTVAEVGSLAHKTEDGELGWATPTTARTLLDVYSKEEVKALTNNSLSRKVVESTEAIDLEAADAEKFIYLVSNASGTYDEYIVVNGALEKMGDWDTDLTDYVKKTEIGTLVDEKLNTSTAIGNLTNYGGDNLTLVEKVEEIDGRLKWTEITE